MSASKFNKKTVAAPLLLIALLSAYFCVQQMSQPVDTGAVPLAEQAPLVSAGVDVDSIAQLDEHEHLLNSVPAQEVLPIFQKKESLGPIFKLTDRRGGLAVPIDSFDDLRGLEVGDTLSIPLADGLELAGELSHVEETQASATYVMELNDAAGRMRVSMSDAGLVGEVLYYGDSRMLQIRNFSQDMPTPSLQVEGGYIDEFYCVPAGSTYTESGLATGSAAGLIEPVPSTAPELEEGELADPIALYGYAGQQYDADDADLPTSENVLYLDFDGGVFTQSDSILLPGLVAAMPHPRVNDEAWVRAVHARVSEDFAPFDILVTTDQEVFAAISDPDKGIHVVITPSDDAAPGTGGVAAIGTFQDGDGDSSVVWVFNNTEYAVAATISHEAGHALGLDDDGTATEQYYGGHNDAYDYGWAPIMGAPWNDDDDSILYDEVVQWSQGDYTGASNSEDDILIIGMQLGFIDDDYVDTYTQATGGVTTTKALGNLALSEDLSEAGTSVYAGQGLISTVDDVDIFKLVVNYSGAVSVSVSPLDVDAYLLEEMEVEENDSSRSEVGARTQGANLAVDMQLLDETGIQVAIGEDAGDAELGSLIEEELAAGVYYLIVDGGARGTVSSGFDDYASLGQYTVEMQTVPGPAEVSGKPDKSYIPIANGSESISADDATDFGFVVKGSSKENSFKIFNSSSEPITINSITFASTGGSSSSFFSVSSVPTSVSSGYGKIFKIKYAPTSSAPYISRDVVTISYNAATAEGGSETVEYSFAIGGTALSSTTSDNYEPNDIYTNETNLSGIEGQWLSDYRGMAFLPKGDVRDRYYFMIDSDDDYVTVNVDYDDSLYDLTFELNGRSSNGYYHVLNSTDSGTGEINYINSSDASYTYFMLVVTDNSDSIDEDDDDEEDSADPDLDNYYDFKWTAGAFEAGGQGEDFYSNSTRSTAFDLSGADGKSLSELQGEGILNSEDWYKITVDDSRGNAYNRMLYIAAEFNQDEDEDEVNIDLEVYVEYADDDYALLNDYFAVFNEFSTVSVETDSDKEVVTVAQQVYLSDFVDDDFSPEGNTNVMGVLPGTYYIRVFTPESDSSDDDDSDDSSSDDVYTGASYDLTVALLSEDNYEVINTDGDENDDDDEAYDLGTSVIDNWLSDVDGAGTLANYYSDPDSPEDTFENDSDRDWYVFDLPSDETVTEFNFEYFFVAEASTVTIYDSSLDAIVSSSSSADTLTVEDPEDTTYYVQFASSGGSGYSNLSGYDFRVVTSALPDVNSVDDDIFEDNDNYSLAYDLTAYEGLSLAAAGSFGYQFDPDWYLIEVPDGATELDIRCLFDSEDGELEISLFGSDGRGTPIDAEDLDSGYGLQILWNDEDSRPLEGGLYVIGVSGDNVGTTYNLTWEVVRGDDNYEENDDEASAYDLTGDSKQWMSKLNGYGYQYDDDFYKIEVPAGSDIAQLQVRTYFDPEAGDIDMALFYVVSPGDYAWVTESTNTDEVESITVYDPEPGEYIVQLYHGNSGNAYDLWWAAFTQSEVDAIEVGDDLYEDNDSLEAAYSLDGDEVMLSGIDGQGIQADDDWYAITVGEDNFGLDIECEFQPQNGDIDIELYDAQGGLISRSAKDLAASGPFDSAYETINFGSEIPAGTYYIRVYGSNLANPYNLYWVERTVDAYEPNNSLDTAYDLAPDDSTSTNLVDGTQSDADWFRIEVSSDSAFLEVELGYMHYFGNIDFAVYDAAGNQLWISSEVPDLEELYDEFTETSFIPVTAGVYYIKVFAGAATSYAYNDTTYETPAGNRWNSYSLTWEEVLDDDFEYTIQNSVPLENDDQDTLLNYSNDEGDVDKALHAADLSNLAGISINAFLFDDDWYKLTLSPGNQALAARIEYTHANGDIDLELYDSAGTLLAGPKADERDPADITDEDPATKDDNYESFSYLVPSGSDREFYLKVSGLNSSDANYELIWTQSIGDDELEENDTLVVVEGSAVHELLADDSYVNSVGRRSATFDAFPSDDTLENAIQFDDDWYYLQKVEGEVQIGIKLNFSDTDGDIGFALYDADGNELMLVDGEVDDEFEIYWASPAMDGEITDGETDIYYIKVFGNDLGTEYSLEWATSTVDVYESSDGNNSWENATDLSEQEGVRLSDGTNGGLGYATSGDEDYYQIAIAEGDDGLIVEAFREFSTDDGFVMELLNSSGNVVAFASPEPNVDPTPTIQRIRYTGAEGVYYVHVYGGLAGNTYDLYWNSYAEDVLESSGEGTKTEKTSDQNDDPTDPRGLQYTTMNSSYYTEVDGTQPDLELVELNDPDFGLGDLTQVDQDWYTLYVEGDDATYGEPADEILKIRLEFDHYQGDIDMALYFYGDYTGDPVLVASSTSSTDDEEIYIGEGETLESGKYLLGVYGYGVEEKTAATTVTDPYNEETSSLGNSYSLRWNSGYDDDYDRYSGGNDSFEDASDLGTLSGEEDEVNVRYLTQFDDDWYKIEVEADSVHQLYALLEFEDVKGDLTLNLYDSNGNLILASETENDYELAYVFSHNGTTTYYLEVVGDDFGNKYTLQIRNYYDDSLEDNDTFETYADVRDRAERLLPDKPEYGFGIENLEDTVFIRGTFRGIQWDDDYYLVEVPKDQVNLEVKLLTLDSDVGDFNIGYTVYTLEEVSRSGNMEYHDLISPEASQYIIRVSGEDIGKPYTLVWEIDNVDEYDGSVSVPNYTQNSYVGAGDISQNGNNNTWGGAHYLTYDRLEPTYSTTTTYRDPRRELVYDEDVISDTYSGYSVGHATLLDDDWYRLQIPSWELVQAKKGTSTINVLKRRYNVRLEIDLNYAQEDGNIDVAVYDAADLDALSDPDDLTGVEPLSVLSLNAEEDEDRRYISVPIDPLDEDREYYIHVYGDYAGNSYELTWTEMREDAYEDNSFVDLAHDLTLAYDEDADVNGDDARLADSLDDFISSEGKWLHEMWQFVDEDEDGVVDAGETVQRGYGNQGSSEDWYAIAVSEGADQLSVQANFYADDNPDHTYTPDDLDFAIDIYRLVEDEDLGIRKPILITRINDKDTSTEPFLSRVHAISGEAVEGDGNSDDADRIIYPAEPTELGATQDFDLNDDGVDDSGERLEYGLVDLPDTEGGIYFIRIFYDARNHPYTFKWDDINDSAAPTVTDADIIEDYLNGGWSYTPDLELPEDIFGDSDGDSNGNGYADWVELALTLDPAESVPGLAAVLIQDQESLEVDGNLDEYYTISYLRSTEAVALGYQFTIYGGEDLSNLIAATDDELISSEVVAPGVERLTYRSTVPVDASSGYFFQLEVLEPED